MLDSAVRKKELELCKTLSSLQYQRKTHFCGITQRFELLLQLLQRNSAAAALTAALTCAQSSKLLPCACSQRARNSFPEIQNWASPADCPLAHGQLASPVDRPAHTDQSRARQQSRAQTCTVCARKLLAPPASAAKATSCLQTVIRELLQTGDGESRSADKAVIQLTRHLSIFVLSPRRYCRQP